MECTCDNMATIYRFPGDQSEISVVGGKGYSLLKMAHAGMPVPPGFVLPTEFFTPWLDTIEESQPWQTLLAVIDRGVSSDSFNEMYRLAETIKALALTLPLDEDHRHLLMETFDDCFADTKVPIVAVRSSSPEEDTAGASFAGMYETRLGIDRDSLESAVRECFASCLDVRIFKYKMQQGFAATRPRIAVVVQQQIRSDMSGVAFSVNPLNNSLDEVLINANFGLGESVVSGMCTPDEYVVDRTRDNVTARTIGKKEVSVWLDEDGGVIQRQASNREDLSLTDEQATAVASIAIAAERHYGTPIDIEWAFENGSLFLLQARPITTLFPISHKLRTKPDGPRRAYVDITLCVQGITKPISVLGEDMLLGALRHLGERMFGRSIPVIGQDIDKNIALMTGGRMYADATKMFKIVGKQRFAKFLSNMDPTAGQIILGLDDDRYDLPLPRELRWLKPSLLFHSLPVFLRTIRTSFFPEKQRHEYIRAAEAECLRLDRLAENSGSQPLGQLTEKIHFPLIALIRRYAFPTMIVALRGMTKLKAMFRDDDEKYQRLVEMLDRGLPDNVTTRMGRALGELARLSREMAESEDVTLKDADELVRRIEAGQMSQPFLDAWKEFLHEYGFRGPMELDVATERYVDNPKMLTDLIFQMLDQPEESSPEALFIASQGEGEAALAALSRRANQRSRAEGRRFDRKAKQVISLLGLREMHKYLMIKAGAIFREAALCLGDRLVQEKRIDHPADVFSLTICDLDLASADNSIDLRERILKYAAERQNYDTTNVPRLIDSRGEIPKPPHRETQEGELAGEPISPGVARGKVKVLRRPDEKPINPGDILVAPATDPGWTPLFINAAAIVLELGGSLQHGALVAREYGKPCVSGVENACKLLEAQEEVEVDGDSGVVRIID